MQVRAVSVDIAQKERAVKTIRSTFSDAIFGKDATFAFERTTHLQGCFENHMQYWLELLATDEAGFWIFEDDVKFVGNPLPTLEAFVARYSLSKRSIFYLGHRLCFLQDTWFERITYDTLRLKTNDTHAYFIGREAAASMLSHFRGVPLDVYMRSFVNSVDMRAIYPMVAIQLGENGFQEILSEKIVVFGPVLATLWRRLLAITAVIMGVCCVLFIISVRAVKSITKQSCCRSSRSF